MAIARLVAISLVAVFSGLGITTLANAQSVPGAGALNYLQDPRQVAATYSASPTVSQALTAGQVVPVAVAKGDFNEDGVEDVIVGYSSPGIGGILALHLGNLDAFAPQSQASWQMLAQGMFPTPFLASASAFQIPKVPSLMAAGRFAGTSHTDIVAAFAGDNSLYLFPGSGRAQFAAPQIISLPSGVTTIVAGRFGSQTAFTSLLVGVSNAQQSQLLIYSGSASGLTLKASYPLSSPATSIVLGDLDGDLLPDAAIVTGGQLQILHAGSAANPKLETVALPLSVRSVLIGTFVQDRTWRQQLAVLGSDGSVSIAAHGGFDPRGWTASEIHAMWAAKVHRQPNPFARSTAPTYDGWQIIESFAGVAPFATHVPLFYPARISAQGAQDLIVINRDAAQMVDISHPNVPAGASTFLPGKVSVKPYSSPSTVGLPMRTNIDARAGLILLNQGQVGFTAMMPLPDPTFVVNTTADTADVNPGDGICADSSGHCSLRAAITEANANMDATDATNPANTQDTIVLPVGTFTLTIPSAGTFDASTGHLDINDGVNIIGAGPGATIIQAANGDQVFSILDLQPGNNPSPDTQGPGIAVNISNLTISGGQATANDFFNLGGGAIVWDAGTAGTGTLNLDQVVITGNSSSGVGGGLALSDFGQNPDSSVTITNSTIQNNTALFAGGGLATSGALSLSVANSRVAGNQVADPNPADGSGQQGGGLFLSSPIPAVSQLHGVTISGNIAGNALGGQGGGVWTSQATLIDLGAAITNNQSGGDGGGVWIALGSASDAVNIVGSTITGNHAAANGGGIQVDVSDAGTVAVSFSRIVNNTSAVGGNGLNSATVGNVSAEDNWWGCNAGPGVVSSGCDLAMGISPVSKITVSHVASPSTIVSGTNTLLTASFQDSAGQFVNNLQALAGVPVSFQNPVDGTISNAQAASQANAAATATFTGTAVGSGSAQATIDHQTVSAAVSIQDFSLSALPASQSVNAGIVSTLTYIATLTPSGGFAASTSVTCSAPAGSGLAVSCPASVNPSGGLPATFNVLVTTSSTTLAGSYSITLTATSGGATRTTAVTAVVADFTVTPSQPSLRLNVGSAGSASDTITLASLSGLSGTIALSCVAPASSGITASCSPSTVNLPANGNASATVSVVTSATTAPGSYTITVTSTVPGITRITSIPLTISDFSVSATPATQTLNAGGTATYSVTLTTATGFSGVVALACTAPSGSGLTPSCPASITLTPAAGSANASASFSMTVSSTAAASGPSAITVAATSGNAVRNTLPQLAVANFTLSATPPLQTTNVGAAASKAFTISASPVNGFAGNIALVATVANQVTNGPSPTLSLSTITSSGSSVLLLNSSALTPAASYIINVTATSGSITQNVSVKLTVADFSLAVSPAAITANAGATALPFTISGSPSLSPLDGFNGSVTFSPADVSGLPAGATVGFTTTQITVANGSATNNTGMTVTTPGSTAPGSYNLTAIGRSGSASHPVSVTLNVPGFSLGVSTSPGTVITVPAGAVATFNLFGQSIAGFTGLVNLSATISPQSGVIAPPINLGPTGINLTSGSQTAFTVTLPTTVFDTPGTYTITVTGTSGNIIKTATVTLVENPPLPDIELIAVPDGPSGNFQAFASTFTAFIEGIGGFNAPLTATVSIVSGPTLPSNALFGWCVTCAQSGGPVPPVYTQSIQFQLGPPAGNGIPPGAALQFTLCPAPAPGPVLPVGTYTINLTVSGGGVVRQHNYVLTIAAMPQWTMTVQPGDNTATTVGVPPQNITQGTSITYTVTLANFVNIVTPISLALAPPLPPGFTATWSTQTLSAPGTATVTINASTSAPLGLTAFQVQSSFVTPILQNPIVEATDRVLNVMAPVLSVTPAAQTISPGASAQFTVTPPAINGCAYVNPIPISVTGLPNNVTTSTSPGTGWGVNTLTIQTSAATAGGNYPLTITGAACGATVQGSATLNISTPPPPPPTGGCSLARPLGSIIVIPVC